MVFILRIGRLNSSTAVHVKVRGVFVRCVDVYLTYIGISREKVGCDQIESLRINK